MKINKNGYVKVNRSIQENWIFKDPWKFRNWIDLILLANYSEQKIEIGGTLFICKRGESLRSLETLSIRWNCDKSKTRRFLKLLEKDKMILLKNEQKTTRITICKYDDYQALENDKETQTKRKRNTNETQTHPNNKENKDNKDNKEDFKNKLKPFLEKYSRDTLNNFYLYWTETTKDNKLRWEKQTAFEMSRRLSTWAKNEKSFNNNESKNDDNDLVNNVLLKISKNGN